jgi:hypothetical protein
MIARGKVPSKKEILEVRVLSRDDLAVLREPRPMPVVQAIKDPHHRLARLLASGLKLIDAAPRAGYSYTRAQLLTKDPSFIELIEQYRGMVTKAWLDQVDDYYDMATSNMLKAETQIAERLEDAESGDAKLSIRDLTLISRDAADRFGYGKKQTNLNVNVDFAAKLESARKRSKLVEVKVVGPGPSSSQTPQPRDAPSAPPRLLRRA